MTLSAAPALFGQGIVNEVWSDGERSLQDIANNSMGWYSSSGSSNVAVSTGVLTQNTGTSGRHMVGYFTDAGSPVVLSSGQSLQVDFIVSFNRATPLGAGNDFRMGVWNSQGARVDADNHNGTSATNSNAAFTGYSGYIFAGGVDASRSISIRKKEAGTDGVLISSTSVYSTLDSVSNGTHLTLDPNVDYSGSLSVSLSGSDVLINYSMGLGGTTYASLARTDSSSPHFSFDTVAFLLGSNVADGFSLKQVEIAVVPEPSTYAALVGLVALGAIALRRRRN